MQGPLALGGALSALRVAEGFSFTEFAKFLGVSRFNPWDIK